jgi:Iodothyronine deiodinase
VYILEAHAADVWQMPSNVTDGVVFKSPTSFAERTSIADSCVRKLHIEIPAVLDNFDNSTERAYTGWPDRLYVIDREGRVAAKSRPGPFGFHPEIVSAKLAELVR